MALSRVDIDATKQATLKCVVCVALRDLPKADGDQLAAWLEDKTISFASIERACKNDPDTPSISSSSLTRHASGVCRGTRGLRTN